MRETLVSHRRERQRDGVSFVLFAALIAASACGGREVPVVLRPSVGASQAAPVATMPGPARARESAAVRDNAACEKCHEDVAASWRTSLHHQSNTNAAYRRSFAVEPMPFCRSCHAPEADPSREESAEVSELGVGCVTCHVTTENEVLAAPGTSTTHSPHRIVRDAQFGEPAACARCHEFAFPGRAARGEGDLMQSTMTEHRTSAAANVTCSACHMPRDASGKKSHAFVSSRDVAFVKRAVHITAERTGPTRVTIVLAPSELGHAFPTGDLFRRLELTAEAAGPDEMVLGSAQRFLTRHFRLPNQTIGRRLVSDDRVRGGPLSVELDVGPEGVAHPIVWRVAYERVAHPNGVDDADATVEEELVLGEGRLAPRAIGD